MHLPLYCQGCIAIIMIMRFELVSIMIAETFHRNVSARYWSAPNTLAERRYPFGIRGVLHFAAA